MAGTFFEYFDGYVRVAQSRAWCGDIFIDFSLFGDTARSDLLLFLRLSCRSVCRQTLYCGIGLFDDCAAGCRVGA